MEGPSATPVLDWGRALTAIAPYVDGRWNRSSAEGSRRIRQRLKNLIHMIGILLLKRLQTKAARSNPESVKEFYEKAHSATDFGGYGAGGRYVTYLQGDAVLSMTGIGNYRLKAALIEQILEQLRPSSVCEAGCGRLRHLAYFAPRFPDIRFSGFDITENAIRFGRELQQRQTFDPALPERPGLLSPEEMERIRAITLFQASASDLAGIPDNAFDMVYTISALEQMNAIIPEVLRELHRVTARYAVFCEPFADGNGLFERLYLRAGNYFQLRAAELERFGFRVVSVVPLFTKPSFADCLVLAQKI